MDRIIEAVFCGTAAIVCLVIAILQLNERGVPLNNAYLYAPKEKRLSMNKSPYFKQAGVVFGLLTVIFAILFAACIFEKVFLSYLALGFCGATLIYALVSAVLIEKNFK